MQHVKYDFSTFKRSINLPTFAANFGYNIDRTKSTKTSIAMKSGNDKVIMTIKGGLWVYFSVFDEQDSGTIIDFVANRSNKSIPEIGSMLADWSGLQTAPLPAYNVESQDYDADRVQAIFAKCHSVQSHPYLESRGLGEDLLSSKRFEGRVFADRYDNVVFPHYQDGKVCGLELKNATRSILVKGSQKTFWRSNTNATDTTIVVMEAVIDALSYQQLSKREDVFYIATGGGVSAAQRQLLSDMLDETPQLTQVVVATDNDQGGDRIARRVLRAVKRSQFDGKTIRRRPKQKGADWNDILKSR